MSFPEKSSDSLLTLTDSNQIVSYKLAISDGKTKFSSDQKFQILEDNVKEWQFIEPYLLVKTDFSTKLYKTNLEGSQLIKEFDCVYAKIIVTDLLKDEYSLVVVSKDLKVEVFSMEGECIATH